jgi:hypothetical protein
MKTTVRGANACVTKHRDVFAGSMTKGEHG